MKLLTWSGSVLFHVLFFLLGSLALSQKAEFGVALAPNSVEVDLVAAAPSEDAAVETPVEEPEETPVDMTPKPEDMLVPEPDKPQIPKIFDKPKPVVKAEPKESVKGDGSSAIPGKDATTLKANRGTDTTNKPGYFRNPNPPYPESLRLAKVEGKVVLSVLVNAQGKVEEVSVKTSSGYPAFDEASVKTIKKSWLFKPARIAGVPVSSQVDIPIRFTLD
jgi:protein TonB